MEGIINENLIKECIETLEKDAKFDRSSISYEIQDDFKFLLIKVQVDAFGGGGIEKYKYAANLIDKLIPQREGEYSWMINFIQQGTVIDSYFGGDSNFRNSGL